MNTYNCQKTADDGAITTFIASVIVLAIGTYAREYGNATAIWSLTLGSTTLILVHCYLLYLERKKRTYASPSDVLRLENLKAKKQRWLICYQETELPLAIVEEINRLELEALKIQPTNRAWIDPFSKLRSLILILFRFLELALNLCALFLLVNLFRDLPTKKVLSQRIDGILFACACACFMRWSISLMLLYIEAKQIEELNQIKSLPDTWVHPHLHKNSDEES